VRASLLGLAVVLALVGGGWLGMRLGERASEPEVRELTFRDPLLLEDTPSYAVRSAGGFTGFGGPPVFDGDVLRSGLVEAADDRSVTFADEAASLRISYSSDVLLFRIVAASTPLEPGDTVLLRTVDGVPAALLRVAGGGVDAGRVAAETEETATPASSTP
jgi:hypothetical protein